MAQIKNVIETLGQILNYYQFSSINAEDFRLAKYNKPDVVKKLWKLLFELIRYNYSESLYANESQQELFDKLSADTVIRCIKVELLRKGYYNDDFLAIKQTYDFAPDDTKCPSREILIAIGWYISNQKLVQKFINNSYSAFDYETANEIANEKLNFNEIEVENQQLDEKHKKFASNLQNDLLFLKSLSGRARKKINVLSSCLTEKSKLLNRAHKYTEDCGPYAFGHLSTFELTLLKNRTLIEKYEDLLKKNSELLSNLISWCQNEGIFWKWMDSVLDEKLKEQIEHDDLKNDAVYKSIVYNIDESEFKSLENSRSLFKEQRTKLKSEHEKAKSLPYTADIDQETFDKLDDLLQVNLLSILGSRNVGNANKTRVDPLFDYKQTRLNLNTKKSKDLSSKPGLNERIKKLDEACMKYKSELKLKQKLASEQCEQLSELLHDAVVIRK